ATARTLFADMARWASAAKDFAATALLDLKNDSWLGERESPVSPKAFMDRMQLSSINVYPEGAFELWHEDGDLFWGHAIHVSGTLRDGIKSASIAG
ncbi:MAG TPA: DUF2262 domain-containing protein, partial [Usitatibacter sp.]|nr:DUF2262 domain-containing protein [Usitatibacter sp.]